jgi:hypothetical protein
MFCPTCATPLDAAQKFCPKCGTPSPGYSAESGFSPPQSSLQAISAATGKPATVRLAGNLLFAAIALSFIGTLYVWTFLARSRIPILSFVPSLLITVLWVVVITQMLQGKSWARIAVVLGIAWSAFVVLTSLRILRYGGPQFGALGLSWISFALRLYAGYLLFRPESNAWFH